MLPEQQLPNPANPQPSPGTQPQAPSFPYGSTNPNTLQQNPNGQYDVVPSLSQNPGRASGHNPYEFIMQPNAAPKNKLANSLGGGKRGWLILAAIGAGIMMILLIVAVVVSSLAPKGSIPGLTTAAQREQELIRVTAVVAKKATTSDVRNFAQTTQITLITNQQQTIAFLAQHNVKLQNKQLALYQSSQTDTLLANAATAGTYDSVALQTITSQLETYEKLLQNTYKQTKNEAPRKLIQANFTTADKLLKQANTVDPNAAD